VGPLDWSDLEDYEVDIDEVDLELARPEFQGVFWDAADPEPNGNGEKKPELFECRLCVLCSDGDFENRLS